MRKKGFSGKKLFAGAMATILCVSPIVGDLGTLTVEAASVTSGTGSYSTEVVGQYSYTNDSGNLVYVNNSTLTAKLPYEGSAYRYTTDNYDANNGAFDTTNWASSFMWDLDGDQPYSSQVYAIPFAYKGESYGLQVTAPSSLSDTANKVYTMQMAENGTLTDFFIKTGFSSSSAKVDAVTDWSYDIIWENSSNTAQQMKATLVQGVPFAYFQMEGTSQLTVERGRTGLPSAVISQSDDGSWLVVRCFDNGDEDYDYYAFYAANGTTWDITASDFGITKMVANLPSGREYVSMAYLGSIASTPDDSWAIEMGKAYYPYAYNYITDTKATYSYDEGSSTVTTKYTYTLDKKAESTADGTIMGILPHQYKHMLADTNYADYTYQTIRGKMKTILGSSYTTYQTYSGILPYMPGIEEEYNDELSTYLEEYIADFGDNYFANYEGCGDTYWDGKGLNRLANAMIAAEDAGDDETAAMLLEALKTRLENWFTYSGSSDDAYFYYDEGVGSLFGFPQSYSSVDQLNDHHFHYGYFIYAAAQVAMRVENWGDDNQYGAMVKELIYDIACPERNNSNSKYPYLRAFAPYEGHSWASGHQNFGMGNNQESSSEALNAWAGIILFGEATGDETLRDLGVYLYTTEVSAVNNYWFDVDEDVLSDAYRYGVPNAQVSSINKETDEVKYNSAAIVWGGSYTYATWFSANPLHIQGINLLPMNPTGFYLAGNKEYIEENIRLAYKYAAQGGWSETEWVDIWCQYQALADPEAALTRWKEAEAADYGVEGGETKAHTYQFIQSLCRYGTPDTSITGNCALSTVFVKDGVKTYAAYNASDEAITVNFSDGGSITVAANSMYAGANGTGSGSESQNKATYKVEYYQQNEAKTGYELTATSTYRAEIGSTIDAEGTNASLVKDYEGFTLNTGVEGSILKGTVVSDGSLVLKLYYDRNETSGEEEEEPVTEAEGFTYSAADQKATFRYQGATGGIVYVAVYDTLATAQEIADKANANAPGFNYVTGHGGYLLSADGDSAKAEYAVAEGKYLVYAFNPDFKGVESWQVAKAQETQTEEVITYEIQYMNMDGAQNASSNTSTYVYGVGLVLADPTKDGYDFGGWYSDAELTTAITQISAEATGTQTVYAKWIEKQTEDSGDNTVTDGSLGFTYNTSSATATFYYKGATGGIVYAATYDSKAKAEEIAQQANANAPGFSYVTGHGGYMLSADGDYAKANYAVEEGKYIVYAFNPDFSGVTEWYVGCASETAQDTDTDTGTKEVSYDSSTGMATFAYEGATGGIVYVAAYDTLATAQEIADKANANAPGFSYVTGHGGYMLSADGGYAKASYNPSGKKYLVYAFNPDFKGVEEWKVYTIQ